MTFPDLGAWLRNHRSDEDSLTLGREDVQGLQGEMQRLRQSNDRMRKQNNKLRKRMAKLKTGEDIGLDGEEGVDEVIDGDEGVD